MATPPLRRSWPAPIPSAPLAGALALATVAGFILLNTIPEAARQLALIPADIALRPWTAITYPFAHPDPLSLVLNLASLMLLATRLEKERGGIRLLAWFAGGTLAGAGLATLQPEATLLGAGPAILGVAIGAARSRGEYPDAPPLGETGRWLAVALAVAALFAPATPMATGPVRIALVGGLIFSLLVPARRTRTPVARQVEAPNSHFNPPGVVHEVKLTTPWDSLDLDSLHEVNRSVVEVLLRRARELGPTHLAPADRELLDRMTMAARLTAERATRSP